MLLVIDNYDSFTYNIVQYLEELGAEVEVVRNDAIEVEDIRHRAPRGLVLSPGPCTPNEAGVSMAAVRHSGQLPLFGICLGLQSIGQALGGRVVRARRVMHGKTSEVCHDGRGVFRGLPSPFTAARYHSLVVAHEGLPDCLEISAWTCDEDGDVDEIMGLRHRELPMEGVQFHPESIASEWGHAMLRNFLDTLPAVSAH